jgi:CheY-like chemotaxis protein
MYRPPTLRSRSLLDGKKVLLIDNNQPTRDVRVSVLRSHGIEVEPAADFSSARSLQLLHHYDWIFLDVRRHFPGDALQFYEQIKDASPRQRFAFLIGPPHYLSLTWPGEIYLEEASRGQWSRR